MNSKQFGIGTSCKIRLDFDFDNVLLRSDIHERPQTHVIKTLRKIHYLDKEKGPGIFVDFSPATVQLSNTLNLSRGFDKLQL